MKIKTLSLLLVLSAATTTFGQSILVNDPADPEASFTAEELIQEVLVTGGECAEIALTNLQENTTGDFLDQSWGYFQNNGTTFPFEEGIVLSSGFAVSAEGPNNDGGALTSNGDGTWPGDPDIEAILNNLTGTDIGTTNATVFEFTFSSVLNSVEFEYIFASEEYEDQFECDDFFRDGFAFLVRGPGIPDDSGAPFGGTNIAAVPGSTNIPVSTLTIHDDSFTCPDVPQDVGINFFPELYVSNSGINNLNEIQFDGRTAVLNTFTLSIVPGETYTMKMVIADRGDFAYDSAVFLNAGSLSLGIDLGDDITVINNNTVCDGDTVILDATVDSLGVTYQWQVFNTVTGMFEDIPGETSPTLVVGTEGEYQITVSFSSGCPGTDSVVVDFFPLPDVIAIPPLEVCDDGVDLNDGISDSFDTSGVEAALTAGQPDVIATAYTDGLGNPIPLPLPNPLSNIVPFNETITVVLTNTLTGCESTNTFDLIVNPLPVPNSVPDQVTCDDDFDGLTIFDTSTIETTLLSGTTGISIIGYVDGAGNPLSNPLPNPFLNSIPNSETIVATIADDITGCSISVNITFNVEPTIAVIPDLELIVCDNASDGSDINGFTTFNLTDIEPGLLAGATGITIEYYETMADITAGTPIATDITNYVSDSTTIFVILTDTTTSLLCTVINSFDLVVAPLPILLNNPVDLVQCDVDTDGFAIFNLTEAEELISLDFENETFTYFDAMGNPIADPIAYMNATVSTETITVTIATVNGCERTATINLEVDTSAIPPDFILTFEECDIDNDGIVLFDFSSATAAILALFPPNQELTLNYYETLADAESEINDITSEIGAYNNNLAFTDAMGVQGIWVRVDGDSANDCLGLGIHVVLVVLPNPVLAIDIPDFEICSDTETAVFDLTTQTPIINGGDPSVQIIYYANIDDYNADPPVPIANPTMYTNVVTPPSPSQTIYYSGISTNGCTSFNATDFNFELIVNLNPTAFPADPIVDCDDDGVQDGFLIIDLTIRTDQIEGINTTGVTTTYHTTETGAMAGDLSIPDPTMFNTNTTIVYARVTNDDTGCFDITPIDITILVDHVIPPPQPIEVCDTDNDGIAPFVLLDEIDNLNGGDDTLIFTFYLTEADANNTPPGVEIDQTFFVNNEPFVQIIYANVANAGGCFIVVPIELHVLDTPILNDAPAALSECDVDEDGFASFDLTASETEILNGLDPLIFTFQWFVTLADAEAGFPEIGDPTAFITMSTTVYAVVTDEGQSPTHRCPSPPVALELIVQPLPVVPGLMERVEVCDDEESGSTTDGLTIFDLNTLNETITGGDVTLNVTYHVDMASADAGTPELPSPYTIGSGPDPGPDETIYVRVEDLTTGCFRIATITLAVIPLPTPVDVSPIEECDNDGDGMAVFDLTSDAISGAIINGEPIALSFHESEADALANINPIADPSMYAATDGTIVYVRAVDTDPSTTTECSTVISITLTVLPSPDLPDSLPDLAECDDDGDGMVTIDLTQHEGDPIIVPTDFILSYHLSLLSAEADISSTEYDPIAPSEIPSFTITMNTTIWVRLENNITGCFRVSSFNALLVTIPTITAGSFTLEECDEAFGFEVTPDGMVTFDLTQLDAAIIGLNTDVEITYFATPADVTAGTPIDPADAYTTDSTTIIAVLQSTLAGSCINQTTVELIVNPIPTLVSDPLPDAITCDDDNDGFGMFDLQDYADQINTDPNIGLAFFETLEDALANDPVDAIDISVLFDNISMMMPMLYVVATDLTTGCNTIYVFNLVVHPVPVIADPAQDISLCDDNDPMGTEVFDLTINTPIVLGPDQDPMDFTVTYHTSEADAQAGVNAIPDPDTMAYTSAGETIWVRVTFVDGSNCFVIDDFELIVEPLPVIVEPTDSFDVCDDDTDEVAVFDLTTLIDPITVGDPLLGVTFYASVDDLNNDIPIANPEDYQNITNPQTIQIVVNTLAGCTAQTQITLRVLPLPTPETFDPSDLVACDGDTIDGVADVDDTDGMLTFNESLQEVIDQIIGDENVSVLLYEDLAEAETGDPAAAITLPYTNSVSGGQTIYARVDHNGVDNFCFVIVEFDIIVNPLPVINPSREDPYTICSDNEETGELTEDLATITQLLDPSQDPADFTITYYETMVEAENEDDPLSLPIAIDEEGSGSDFIFVRVVNTTTGCFVIVSVEVIVEASPVVVSTAPDLTQCADDPGINGIPVQNASTFDLTVQDGVINPGMPVDTTIAYFTDVDLTQLITDPGAFVATGTGGGIGVDTGITQQTIYATVTNDITGCMSEIVSFELYILELPFTDLDSEGELCVDPITGAVISPPVLDATPQNEIAGVTYNYAWTLDGASFIANETVMVNQMGTYQVTVTATYDDPASVGNLVDCMYTAQVTFTSISAPLFDVEVVEESFNASGLYTVNVINVTGADGGPFEFALDDGPFQTGADGNPATTFNNVTPGSHTITGRRVGAPDDCGETVVPFGIIDFPRFFTPNSDGFNETWNILGLGTAPNLNARVFIFNREGKLLKQLSPLGPGWDGTFNGQPVPSNDYWFKVEFIEPATNLPREFTNHFTLKR